MHFSHKSLFDTPERRWKDNIKTDGKEIAYKEVNWIHLAQGINQWRDLVNTTTKENDCLLGCQAMWSGTILPTFQTCLLPLLLR
jgi:hypothetical protein